MAKKRDPIVREVLARMGKLKALSVPLGISEQAVWKWDRIPTDRVIDVERVTGIPRERLRPDIYGAPRPRPSRSRRANLSA